MRKKSRAALPNSVSLRNHYNMPQRPSPAPAALFLEDGTLFFGKSFGQPGTTTGEICFNTGMTGYQEVFTDPSYFGQLLIMNNAHIGNYGVRPSDVESDRVQVRGVIGRNLEAAYSRPMAEGSLQAYFQTQQVVAIDGVDTRALVAHVRQQGAMNAIISTEFLDADSLRQELSKVPSMAGLELASQVTTSAAYELGDPTANLRIAVLDFGVKRNILTCLTERGAYLRVHPADTSFETLMAFAPHGFFISNGPGDPGAMPAAVATVKQILATGMPVFGICLGHQLLALANDIPTFKMHHGHRGLNHPVRNLQTGKSEITTQNHGFGVDPEAIRLSAELEVTHINLNDQSIEGIRMRSKPAFSVQYHPEATPGPHDSRYLFDQFIELIRAHQASTL